MSEAVITIHSLDGETLQIFNINATGAGQIMISAGTLKPGTYEYDLTINHKLIDTKKMIIIGQ